MSIKCESVGDVVCIKGKLFDYKRVNGTISLTLSEDIVDMEIVYNIKETIQIYEELIALNLDK